ncbi:hypothetical protein [Paenibacillus sonchi]|uniref:hypothetical protein n=1 Tax=Paenibacillus sonchi TaxID=373687 RepID=UPI001E43F35F|nr:hypothetical protein [Paenibacillus sonchi]MCE3203399.1 hypothetical protein [Paenibacillus sonchi]
MKFTELNERNSTIIEVERKELRTTQDPHVSDDGNQYIAEALDAEGNTYLVTWEVIDHETTDESSACDWDNPVGVTLVK